MSASASRFTWRRINAVPGAPIEFGPGGNLGALNRQTNSLTSADASQSPLGGQRQQNTQPVELGFRRPSSRVYFSSYTDAEESFFFQTSGGYTQQHQCQRRRCGVCDSGLGRVGSGFHSNRRRQYLRRAGRGTKPALAQKYFALYSQNDWRASSKLTINLGLPGNCSLVRRTGTTELQRVRFQPEQSLWDGWGLHFIGIRAMGAISGLLSMATSGRASDLHTVSLRTLSFAAGTASPTCLPIPGTSMARLPTARTRSRCTDGLPFRSNPAGVLAGHFNEVNTVVQPTGADVKSPRLYGGSPGPRLDVKGLPEWGRAAVNLFVERGWAAPG